MQRKFLDYNTLQYTLADPRYAVDYYTDDVQRVTEGKSCDRRRGVGARAQRNPHREQDKK